IHVAGTYRRLDEIEFVHSAVIHRLYRGFPVMNDISREFVARVIERNDLSRRYSSSGGAVRAGKGSEVVIETAIFLDDEDKMIDDTDVLLLDLGASFSHVAYCDCEKASDG